MAGDETQFANDAAVSRPAAGYVALRGARCGAAEDRELIDRRALKMTLDNNAKYASRNNRDAVAVASGNVLRDVDTRAVVVFTRIYRLDCAKSRIVATSISTYKKKEKNTCLLLCFFCRFATYPQSPLKNRRGTDPSVLVTSKDALAVAQTDLREEESIYAFYTREESISSRLRFLFSKLYLQLRSFQIVISVFESRDLIKAIAPLVSPA